MAKSTSNEAGERGSRDLWLAAAYETLVESGVDAVRIQPLARGVNLSRTSFYWFFPDREALLGALLDLWRDKNTAGLVGRTEAFADSITEAILNVFDCWLDPAVFDSQFEFAIRSWSLQSPAVLAAVQEADETRLEALTAMLRRFGFDALAADVRARAIYFTQIGYIGANTREDLALRMRRIPAYIEIFTGTVVEPRELARFHARHRFPPAAAVPHDKAA